MTSVRLIILDSFIAASLIATRLTTDPRNEGLVNLIVSDDLRDESFGQIQFFIGENATTQIIDSQYREIPHKLKLANRLGVKISPRSLRRERKIRLKVLESARALLSEADGQGDLTEIWAATSHLTAALMKLRPSLRFVKVDHGLSDILMPPNSRLQLTKMRQVRRYLEQIALGYSQTTPLPDERILATETTEENHLQMMNRLWRSMALDRKIDPDSRQRVLFLAPVVYELTGLNHIELIGRWILHATSECGEIGQIVIKAHPTNHHHGAADYVEELLFFLRAQERFVGSSVVTVSPTIPSEVILCQGFSLVLGALSTTFLMARMYFPDSVSIHQLDWSDGLRQMIAQWPASSNSKTANRIGSIKNQPDLLAMKFWLERAQFEHLYWEPEKEIFFRSYPHLAWKTSGPQHSWSHDVED